MPPLYASYDTTTASRIVRWHRDKLYAELAIWDPPGSFAGSARPVYWFEPGGARRARNDLGIGDAESSPGVYTVPGYMTNVLGAFVVVCSTPPGGVDFSRVEESGQEFSPECRISAAMARMFWRANVTNTAVVGNTHTASALRKDMAAAGVSAGSWNQLGAEMIPPGDLVDIVGSGASRGGGRFRYHHDHTAGHFLASIGQNNLAGFSDSQIDPALVGDGSYTLSGAVSSGSSTIPITGDSALLYRGGRIIVSSSSSYVVGAAGGSNGATTLPVTGSAMAIPEALWVEFTVGGNTYRALVTAPYAGGTGSIEILNDALEEDIPAGTAVRVVQEFAITADYAGGSGSVSVWPTAQVALASGSTVEVQTTIGSPYGAPSWASGYVGDANSNRPWRSDDASGRGVPMQEKVDASVQRFLTADNPRSYELNLFVYSPFASELQFVDRLTGERSFWTRRNVAAGTLLPEHINLHSSADMAEFCHRAYLLRAARGRNTAGIAAYLGGRRDNPRGTDASVPWLLGRANAVGGTLGASFGSFVTNAARFGGAFGA